MVQEVGLAAFRNCHRCLHIKPHGTVQAQQGPRRENATERGVVARDAGKQALRAQRSVARGRGRRQCQRFAEPEMQPGPFLQNRRGGRNHPHQFHNGVILPLAQQRERFLLNHVGKTIQLVALRVKRASRRQLPDVTQQVGALQSQLLQRRLRLP